MTITAADNPPSGHAARAFQSDSEFIRDYFPATGIRATTGPVRAKKKNRGGGGGGGGGGGEKAEGYFRPKKKLSVQKLRLAVTMTHYDSSDGSTERTVFGIPNTGTVMTGLRGFAFVPVPPPSLNVLPDCQKMANNNISGALSHRTADD